MAENRNLAEELRELPDLEERRAERQPVAGQQAEGWENLDGEIPDSEPKFSSVGGKGGTWVQDSSVRSGSTGRSGSYNRSVQRTDIDVDPEGKYFQPVGVKYAPKKFEFNPDDPFIKQLMGSLSKPYYDEDKEGRLKRVARLNAFGDFMKHLGAFAGGGYAPVEKRQENKNVLRAFQELDRMRDLYDARMDRYNDKKDSWLMQALRSQKQAHEAEESRRYGMAERNAAYENAARSDQRSLEIERNKRNVSESEGGTKNVSEAWQNASRNMADPRGTGTGSGGGKGWRLFITDNNVKDLPASAKNITNLARAADIIERELPGTRPVKPKITIDVFGAKIMERDANGNIVMEPDNSQEALERYLAFGFGNRVGGLEAWAANLAGEETKGGQTGGRPAGEVPPTADKDAPPFVPSGLEDVHQKPAKKASSGTEGQIEVPQEVLNDLKNIVEGEGTDRERKIAILKRLKEAGYSAEDAKRIVGHITV